MFCFEPLTTFGLGGPAGSDCRGLTTPAKWLRNSAASFQANEACSAKLMSRETLILSKLVPDLIVSTFGSSPQ